MHPTLIPETVQLTCRAYRTGRVSIRCAGDIIAARRMGRSLAEELGFAAVQRVTITVAISEIARNILDHADGPGEISIDVVRRQNLRGIRIVAVDHGPGIADPGRAIQYGCSSKPSMGLGLPAARRAMDEFELKSVMGQGTTVIMTKWKNS